MICDIQLVIIPYCMIMYIHLCVLVYGLSACTPKNRRVSISPIVYRHVAEEVEKQWSTFDQDGDGYITWEEFNDRKYGMIGTDKNSCYKVLE